MRALVPRKSLDSAKLRLAHVLDRAGRARLAAALFDHVCTVLAEAGLSVVALAQDGRAYGAVETWPEARPGLNGALHAALERIGGDVLVVVCDLPWLSVQDVWALLEEPGDVVVCAARDGGTTALLMRGRVRPRFGERSALAHALAAREAGLRARVVEIGGFAADLDDEVSLRKAGARLRRAPALDVLATSSSTCFPPRRS